MLRKLSMILLLVWLASLFMASPASAEKSYYAERFDVQVDIQTDGSAIVTETVGFRFSGDPFTFAFREISAANTDGLTFLEASMDGVPMPLGTQAGQVEVQAGNPLKVTWHFPPTSDAARILTVRYRADGVIRKGIADTLIWHVIPEDHDYSITKSTITLTFPPQATLLEMPTLSRDFEAASTDGRFILTCSGLAEGEDLVLTANFTPDSLTQFVPQWQLQDVQTSAAKSKAMPFGFGAGVVTLVLGALGLFAYARANTRELNISPIISNANPPSDFSPAVIGKLTRQQHTFMGAIFDLAQRGVLEVREDKGFWGTRNHLLVRKEGVAALKPFEQGMLDALFKPNEMQINMNETGMRLASKSKLFDEPLEQELIQRGWLDPERKTKKTWLTVAGTVVVFLSMFVAFVGVALGTSIASQEPALLPVVAMVIGFSGGAFLLSLAVLIYAGSFSVLTPAGEEQSARWQGFAQYLTQVSKGREPAIRPDYFEKYLAYAAVFGLGAAWAKYFQQLGGVPLPVWFHAIAGSDGDFGAMVAVMSSSDTAGSTGGVNGGGGASGGGSSGAG